MAWYTEHRLRFRGRLVKITTRYGALMSAEVLKGKPLDFRNEDSPDFRKLDKLFRRNAKIQAEIAAFDEGYSG